MLTFIIIVAILWFLFGRTKVSISASRGNFGYDGIDVRILSLAQAVIRADGKIDPAEVHFVRQAFISQFGQARAERAFSNIKNYPGRHSIESTCRELMFSLSYDSRQSVLVFLFQVATSDGAISNDEVRVISSLAGWMGIAQQHFYYIYSLFTQQTHRDGSYQRGSTGASAGRDPYRILEVSHEATVEEIKQSYRILAKKYHPDRLVKYPLEEQRIARDKFIEIQDAYDRIKKERGF